ncbi:MAG: helix-turn-helix domain-containing protein [Bacteroidetes bacterium]|nr:helix-turn-helix domain-containing protein [Bacteroidota bacterium]
MAENPVPLNDFVSRITSVMEQNIANEQFGVSELADALNMSRSNLLRKVKKETKLSVSQFINQVRLARAMELLRKSSLNVSEVSHQVGFNSPSYFIKCFREYYGYPPGEVGNRPQTELVVHTSANRNRNVKWAAGVGLIVLIVSSFYLYKAIQPSNNAVLEKSIAVLPFKNESSDSTNVYLINGLMESTLNNLQKIKDLRVISRTSSEKYRNTNKSIPEITKELNVSYFVEGSGQKVGDQIVLNVQLIEGATDRHLWSAQYKRKTKDIFQLQQEIAKSIAEEIKVIITPDETRKIEKKPTNNLAAYDLFLKGKNLQIIGNKKNLEKAIEFFKQATELDEQFAMAYGEIAITYYNIEIFKTDKKHIEEISAYADKALLYDPKLGESLLSKAMALMAKKEYEAAVPYLEKALEYNPNSALVIGFLADFYSIYMPNTGKYLQYALKGFQLDIASLDSMTASYTCLRLGNALIQNGFVEESLKYIDKSLGYYQNNPFSRYIRAFILFAKTRDAKQTRELLLTEFRKDTTRFDILQDIGKVSYFMKDYEGAGRYYKRFLLIRESQKLDVYRHENLTIGFVMDKIGEKKKSKDLIENYKEFAEADKSIYRNLILSGYYIYMGDRKKAVEHMKLFSNVDNVQYWIILFLEDDPLMESIKDDPEFKQYFNDAKSRFWKSHETLKTILEGKGLL